VHRVAIGYYETSMGSPAKNEKLTSIPLPHPQLSLVKENASAAEATFRDPQVDRAQKERQAALIINGHIKPVERFMKQPNGYLTYEDNATGVGLMLKSMDPASDKPREIPHTVDNDHLIYYNRRTGIYEMVYHKSADIVGLLEIEKAAQENGTEPRARSFYTKDGEFYTGVVLKEFRPVRESDLSHKVHMAVFTDTETGSEIYLEINDLYNLALALPDEPWHPDPITWQSEGGDNN
jgi:hypothetical protein